MGEILGGWESFGRFLWSLSGAKSGKSGWMMVIGWSYLAGLNHANFLKYFCGFLMEKKWGLPAQSP